MGLVRNLCNACGHPSGVDHFVSEVNHRWLDAIGLKSQDIPGLIRDFFRDETPGIL